MTTMQWVAAKAAKEQKPSKKRQRRLMMSCQILASTAAVAAASSALLVLLLASSSNDHGTRRTASSPLRRLNSPSFPPPSSSGGDYGLQQESSRPPRLFYCGAMGKTAMAVKNAGGDFTSTYNRFGIRIAERLFPKLTTSGSGPVPLTRDTLKLANENDVLVMVMHQWCDVSDLDEFPGKQLHLNSEYYDVKPRATIDAGNGSVISLNHLDHLNPNPHVYMLGTHEDTPHRSLRVTFMQMLLATRGDNLRRLVFDPSLKPVPSIGASKQRHFCLYANSHFVKYREVAADEISRIGTLHTAGKCQGNAEADVVDWREAHSYEKCVPFEEGVRPFRIHPLPPGDFGSLPEQMELLSQYRFALVMENINSPGYITEKIMVAFMAGCIPIYYGTEEIFDIFNREAFVYYDINNPKPALDRIRYLESNPEAYRTMLEEQPILADGERTVAKYFSFEDGLGAGVLKRQVWDMMDYSE